MVNIIKASEEAGTLDVVLKDLKDQVQKDIEFTDKIKSALTYPIIIFIVFLIVLLVILVVVIPKIATVFVQLKVDLPLPTRILIILSDYITKSTLPFLGICAGLIVFLFLAFKFRRHQLLSVIFALPLISNLIKQIDITRFSRSMFLLLTSGITITSALDLTQDVVLRRDVSKSITEAKEAILAGSKLSEALRERKAIFPGIILKLVEAGEKTGTLDQAMQDISNYMDYQVSTTLKTLTTLLEPLMLVGVGLLVGGMMMSIIAPIYGLISQVGGR
jgi:type II secretory pathway component PulF